MTDRGRFDRSRRDDRERRDDRSRHDDRNRRDDRSRRDDRERAQELDAVRKAAEQRPDGGYRLDDFDDIPFHPNHRPTAAAPAPELPTEGVRLQKALANAGVASRRVCEQYITAGRVSVNGNTVTELGTRINPDTDRVRVDGTPVQLDQTKRYLLLNKPERVVSTMHDEHGRPDLRQFTTGYTERLYNVGRLDYETSGLLILTNDGELAHILAHPSFEVTKTYIAKVRGKMPPAAVQQLRDGFELEDGFIKADSARILSAGSSPQSTLVELTLHSGRNRIVRRMLAHVGFPVRSLVRRSFGPLHLGTLRAGEVREFTREEIGKVLKLARRAERHGQRAQADDQPANSDQADARQADARQSGTRQSGARQSGARQRAATRAHGQRSNPGHRGKPGQNRRGGRR